MTPRWFTVRIGTEPKPCKGCGKPVYWVIDPSDRRRVPVDCAVDGGTLPGTPDLAGPAPGRGISHFLTCPKADQFRPRF